MRSRLAYDRSSDRTADAPSQWRGLGYVPDRLSRGKGGSGASSGGGIVITGPPSGVGVDLAPWVYADLAAASVAAGYSLLIDDSREEQWSLTLPGSSSTPATSSGSWIPLVTGAEPPVLVSDGNGALIVVAYN